MSTEEEITSDMPEKIRFEYEKGGFFRTIHVDGALGGPTAQGNLQMAFYNERIPIPKGTENAVLEDGTIGEEISRDGRQCVFREIEVSVVMSLSTAQSLHEWLGRNIETIQKLHAFQESQVDKKKKDA